MEGREYHQAIAHIHSQLQEQISFDSLSGLVERLRHEIQTASARQANKSIPQIFAAGKDKHGENDDEGGGSQWSEEVLDGFQRVRGETTSTANGRDGEIPTGGTLLVVFAADDPGATEPISFSIL